MASIVIPSKHTQKYNIPQPMGPTGNGTFSSVTGPSRLSNLTDVYIPDNVPYDGYVLTYRAQTNKWSPEPVFTQNNVYISISITGVMISNEVLMQYALPEAVSIPIGGAQGSFAIASKAATNKVISIINKNSQQVGTIIWGAGQTSGTINIPSIIHLIAGDVLQLVAPATPDTTLANIGVTFACVKGG